MWDSYKNERNNSKSKNDDKNTDSSSMEVYGNRIYFYSRVKRGSILNLNKKLRSKTQEFLAAKRVYGWPKIAPLFLHIQSYGGGIHPGLSGMDTILELRKQIPIATIVDGCCASAATFLSIVGTRRFITPHSYMLIHQLSSGMWGKYSELKDEMKSLDRIMGMIRDIYTTYTGFPEKELNQMLNHDLWLDAKTCLKFGLVDEILQ